MVIDIASLDLKGKPILSLENLDETPIAILGNAFNLVAHIAYNEISSITFDLPAYSEGVKTPGYDKVVGTRLIRFDGWGVFILVNPETAGDGIKEIKSCKAYSREYEFTYKKMSLEENTYNLWNPVMPDSTILGIVLSCLPYWSVGSVDSDLIGKYRTFSENNVNVYNFLKSTVQTKYGCIVDFDTVNRRINLRSTANHAATRPVFLSYDNLLKEIECKEDTENIFTCLDVNGADGVTIRSVNPTGTNKIYNLDYYMKPTHLPREFIDKWMDWKRAFRDAQSEYYLLTIERMLKTSEIVFTQSEIDDTGNAELKALEAQQSVYIEELAISSPDSDSYNEANAKLNGGTWHGLTYHGVNNYITEKKAELETKRGRLAVLEAEKSALTEELEAINQRLAFESFFTESEILLLKQYFKEDSITDSSFVYAEAKNYEGQDDTAAIIPPYEFKVEGTDKDVTSTASGRMVISCSGGSVTIGTLSASLIKATAEYNPTTQHTVFTAYLSAGNFNGTYFPDGCLTAVTDGGTFVNGSTLSFAGGTGRMYFTRNTTEYEKYAVEWDLYEYGRSCLEKLAYPSYSFSLDSANFLSIDAFDAFTSAIKLGDKVYVDMSDALPHDEEAVVNFTTLEDGVAGYLSDVLTPIFVGFEVDFEDPSSLKLEFGDKYCLNDPAFELADLLDQSVSMGKTVDVSRFGYNAFIDSGASTAVKDYMDAALDVSKQAILSSGDMAISWDESGIRLRKWNAAHTGYNPEQIAIINNNIVFTDDAWESAKMAIGHFKDAIDLEKDISDPTTIHESWGVVAPSVVGTLLAGENLVIESKKQDGGVAVFKVDADGAVLHNSKFDIVRSNFDAQTGQATSTSTHILLDPELGFGLGTYPVQNPQTGEWDATNAKFYVDMQGNVHMSGTLDAADGHFSGSLDAATGTFNGVVRASDFQYESSPGTYTSMLTTESGTKKFKSDFLSLKGIEITDGTNTTFSVTAGGAVTVNGNITMGTGSSISWTNVTETGGRATKDSDFNNSSTAAGAVADAASSAQTAASNAQTTAGSALNTANMATEDILDIVTGVYDGSSPPSGRTTFINGRSIYSPTIVSDNFVAMPLTSGGTGHYRLVTSNNVECLDISYYESVITYADFTAGSGGYLRMMSPTYIYNGCFVRTSITLDNNGYSPIYGTMSQRNGIASPGSGRLFFVLDS